MTMLGPGWIAGKGTKSRSDAAPEGGVVRRSRAVRGRDGALAPGVQGVVDEGAAVEEAVVVGME